MVLNIGFIEEVNAIIWRLINMKWFFTQNGRVYKWRHLIWRSRAYSWFSKRWRI